MSVNADMSAMVDGLFQWLLKDAVKETPMFMFLRLWLLLPLSQPASRITLDLISRSMFTQQQSEIIPRGILMTLRVRRCLRKTKRSRLAA